MYAPAGNNAMEYYLALRDKQPNDAAIASALTDLLPLRVDRDRTEHRPRRFRRSAAVVRADRENRQDRASAAAL
jgi:hypothetical protein